jgi:hypothetical protein
MLKARSTKRARPDKGRAAGSPRAGAGKPQAADTFRDFIRTLEKLDRGAARSRETSGSKEGGR